MPDSSYSATLAWEIAAAEAGAAGSPFLGPEHLLIGICSLEKLLAAPPHRAAHDVIDIQHPACRLRIYAAFIEREHGPLGDDEQAAQLREPGDHIVGECVGRATPDIGDG